MLLIGKTHQQVDNDKFNYDMEECMKARQRAYQIEADPIFFDSQRGEKTKDEWLAKIAEIKQRYPKPTR